MNHQKNLLVINGSARSSRSLSRMLANRLIDTWRSAGLSGEIIQRNVGTNPPPFISEEWIAAAFKPEAERTKQDEQILEYSDQAIAELSKADVIVIATPMYNYGLPAAVKAWFDQVIRIGKTFSFDLARGDTPLEPTLSSKRLDRGRNGGYNPTPPSEPDLRISRIRLSGQCVIFTPLRRLMASR